MRNRSIVLVAALAMVFSTAAYGQNKGAGKYSSSVMPRPGYAGDFTMPGKAKGKVQIKPSKKDGDAGWTIQLNVKGIDCPLAGNDGGEAGKCGLNDVGVAGHQMELNILALGAVGAKVAVEFQIEKGKTTFVSTGKNKQGAGGAGALATVLFNTNLAIDSIRLHEPGSDPLNAMTGCGVIPLPEPNTCLDGPAWAFTGIQVGEDLLLTCSSTAECDNAGAQPALICSGMTCVTEPCAVDADCDQDGGGSGGTGECDCGAGTCCDPGTNPGCAAIC